MAYSNVSMLWHLELFDSGCRGTALAIAIGVGRTIVLHFPQLPTEEGTHRIHTSANLLIPGVVVVIYTWFMPETKNKMII